MAGRSAEIVIFPGVRYNRASESIHKNEQNNSKAARDILELVE
jgi:hypothetical protein